MSTRKNDVYSKRIENASKCTIREAWCWLSTTLVPCGLCELPYAICVCHRWANITERASQTSSFEKDLSMIVQDDKGLLVLLPNPCVGGWIMHPLSRTYVVNGLAWR